MTASHTQTAHDLAMLREAIEAERREAAEAERQRLALVNQHQTRIQELNEKLMLVEQAQRQEESAASKEHYRQVIAEAEAIFAREIKPLLETSLAALADLAAAYKKAMRVCTNSYDIAHNDAVKEQSYAPPPPRERDPDAHTEVYKQNQHMQAVRQLYAGKANEYFQIGAAPLPWVNILSLMSAAPPEQKQMYAAILYVVTGQLLAVADNFDPERENLKHLREGTINSAFFIR